MISSTSLLLLSLASSIFAKTDLAGCTSSDVVANGGASVLWYVPGSGEICAFLDCGGGTAPPATNVAGCPLYSGSASYIPSYVSGFATPTAMFPSAGAEQTATFPGTGILTDSSVPTQFPSSDIPSSGFLTATATAPAVGTETTTLGEAGSGTTSAPTLVTTALIFDTSAATEPVTDNITATSPAPSGSSASVATTNAAVVGSKAGKEVLIAAFGAAAGLVLL